MDPLLRMCDIVGCLGDVQQGGPMFRYDQELENEKIIVKLSGCEQNMMFPD